MPKALINGEYVDVPAEALFTDDGQTPFVPPAPTGPVFTAEDIERARSQERDKLYPQIESLTTTINGLNEKVGTLTAAEQQRLDQAEAERARLEKEARATEESELDARGLLDRTRTEWEERLTQMDQTWSQRLEEERQARETAEALAQREREFHDLQSYAQQQVRLHTEGDPAQGIEPDIAPQLVATIGGNTQEEIDASIARAVQISEQIATEVQATIQQFAPQQQVASPYAVPAQQQAPAFPTLPGVRPTAGPNGFDSLGDQQQTLTPEQIKNMPMDQYARLRGNLGVSGSNRNVGMFG